MLSSLLLEIAHNGLKLTRIVGILGSVHGRDRVLPGRDAAICNVWCFRDRYDPVSVTIQTAGRILEAIMGLGHAPVHAPILVSFDFWALEQGYFTEAFVRR